MKKFLGILLTAFLLFSVSACNNTLKQNSSLPNAEKSDENSDLKTESSSDLKNNSKTLVVYFSATGNTKKTAGDIAAETGADLFELIPINPYSSQDLDYTNEKSRVYTEHSDTSKQNIPLKSVTVKNWENYTTVYIGYPIWWGEAAWPVNSFVTSNNFNGKTVIPFCTSASSDIGNSDKELSKKANGGNWKSGKRFSSYADSSEVKEWLEKQ